MLAFQTEVANIYSFLLPSFSDQVINFFLLLYSIQRLVLAWLALLLHLHLCSFTSVSIYYIIIHHHIVPPSRISLTLSSHFSLSFIASGKSSGLHPVSSQSCCMYVRAGRPLFILCPTTGQVRHKAFFKVDPDAGPQPTRVR